MPGFDCVCGVTGIEYHTHCSITMHTVHLHQKSGIVDGLDMFVVMLLLTIVFAAGLHASLQEKGYAGENCWLCHQPADAVD